MHKLEVPALPFLFWLCQIAQQHPLLQISGYVRQIWYADDAAAVGKVSHLREWWEMLTKESPSFSYTSIPNPNKTWLVTKEGSILLGPAPLTRRE